MELKLINDQGQPAATLNASDSLFARDYNEALVHQVVVAYQANARSGNRAQKDREQWSYFPELAGRKLQPEGQSQDVSRRHGSDTVAAGS